tara:strand:- start:44561 stop:45850 length:1290 start_codon:yes stop_codon:yes gene_type:complete
VPILKGKKIYIIVFVVSVLGLFVVQYQYLKIGLNLAKVQFNKNITAASRVIQRDLTQENELTFLIGKSITKDGTYFNLSLDSVQEASSNFLNDFLVDRLAANSITTNFSYQLISRDSTGYLRSPSVFKDKMKLNSYPILLDGYLPNLLGEKLILELQFNDINTYFLYQLNGLTIPSLIFILAIIIVVIWVLKSFYWQRKVLVTTNEFINNLTHELKTPVFSIGLATKILEKDIKDEQKPILKLIREQVDRLKNHIDKVLELGSLEERKKVFDLQIVDFNPYLNKLCEEFQTLSTLDDIVFKYKIPPGKILIKAEVSHLENTFNNLLDNAKKYSKFSEIILLAEVKRKKLVVRVIDKGEGISKKDKDRVFQKFYRIVDGDLYKVKGYGLGLSYVKKVVQKHNGKIFLESEVGVGTTITIQLPVINYDDFK